MQTSALNQLLTPIRFIEDVGFGKLRSLTPALSQWERESYADRCPSRRSIVSDIAVCGRRDVSLPRSIQSQRAAKQRSELSPGRGFGSLGLTL